VKEMLKINILDSQYHVRVEDNGLNYTLVKRQVIKNGKRVGQESETIIGYYSDLKHALSKFASLAIVDEDVTPKEALDISVSIRDYIQKLKTIQEKLDNAIYNVVYHQTKNKKGKSE